MRILEYCGLDTSRCRAAYRKAVDAIERDDFRSADVKKLSNLTHGKYYRAKLDYADRLLFTVIRHGDAVYALMLEVIANHAYDKSRFLRGAEVDDDKIPAIDAAVAASEAEPVRYIHPERREIHLLDKVISFDDAQDAIYRMKPPLIVVGSAGSGKTALTLEKMKHVEGEVLYVTHSAYLAQSARDLYYGHGFEREGQEATFLSYREFLETIRVPRGREATWRDFAAWFGRMRQQFKGIDAHQAFEEIRGVIAADAGGVLTPESYRGLGVRQSIFAENQRAAVYELFEKYRSWLGDSQFFDLNLLSHEWAPAAQPRYDFVVVDEVQDLTTAQLALILKTLKKPGHFLLCGDSNQIVHPNFFSWSKVKSLFWRDPDLAARQELKILRANFRNARETTRVANTLLKIKHQRFGSIDRESNFLVEAIAADPSSVTVLADKDGIKKELNQKTKGSTRFAVLVMRDEDKGDARRHFDTPLVFSIHEAKGLEYENILIYRFISTHRAEYSHIVEGVTADDLKDSELEYRRAKDKADKSLEVYKFYVNALYVALTRAIRHVYLIESDLRHPLLALLEPRLGGERVEVEAKASSRDDWQKEARKLELQGKQEQADAIRQTILKQTPVPWPVFDELRLRDTLTKVFREQLPGSKLKQQLYEYAAAYDEPVLAGYLIQEANYSQAKGFTRQRATLGYRHLVPYYARQYKAILQECDRHGIDHRLPTNQTPLMAASIAGNVPLIETLLERGANPETTDHLGRNALHWALLEAFRESKFAKGAFAAVYERVAPAAVDVMVGERLVRIDRHLSEYLVWQTLWVLFKSRFQVQSWKALGSFNTDDLLDAWQHLPPAVVRPHRNKRAHLSSVLSRNELDRDYAYNRRLFKRIKTGWYQFNPTLAVRRKNGDEEAWVPIFRALNLPLVKEFAEPRHWADVDRLAHLAGAEAPGTPLAGARIAARMREEQQRREEAARRAPPRLAGGAKRPEVRATEQWVDEHAAEQEEAPAPWGTPQAKAQALEKLRRKIEEQERLRKLQQEK